MIPKNAALHTSPFRRYTFHVSLSKMFTYTHTHTHNLTFICEIALPLNIPCCIYHFDFMFTIILQARTRSQAQAISLFSTIYFLSFLFFYTNRFQSLSFILYFSLAKPFRVGGGVGHLVAMRQSNFVRAHKNQAIVIYNRIIISKRMRNVSCHL